MVIIDVHVHPFLSESEILAEMNRAGVDLGVLLGADSDPTDVDKPEIKKRITERFY